MSNTKLDDTPMNFDKFIKAISKKESLKLQVQPEEETSLNKQVQAKYKNTYIDSVWIGRPRYK